MAASSFVQPTMSHASRPDKLAILSISAASSPGSVASPSSGPPTPTTTHPLAIKPAAGSPQPFNGMGTATLVQPQIPKNSITSKEWVVPPRPKPGRKPATDTPPTKRKAQNRAAQRAFRERRAARVGELEEQLDEQRDEHERIERDLQDRVHGLDMEMQTLRSQCSMLEDLLERERTQNGMMSSEIEALRRQLRDERPHLLSRSQQLQAPLHHHPRNSNATESRNSVISIAQIISPPEPSSDDHTMSDVGCGLCDPNGSCACVDEVLANTSNDSSVECGRCSLGNKCECLEAALSQESLTNHESNLKRRPSSLPSTSAMAPEEKRQKPLPNYNENEIDFTVMFSKKRQQPVVVESAPTMFQPLPQTIAIPPRDSCGFCTEGTYCMCAEAAAAAAASQSTLPPMGGQSQVQTPPPSEDDVVPFSTTAPAPYEVTATGAIKLPSLFGRDRQNKPAEPKKTGGCGPNGPGSCAQCLADPKSGLFCRSLAANLERQGKSRGCCGGNAGGGGCCKSGNAIPNAPSRDSPGLSLSCADAYKTLSSHRNFERAADEIGIWLPKLKAVPMEIEGIGRDGAGSGHWPMGRGTGLRGRCPVEVETASIMSVLKGFDVRFGREG